MRRFPGHPRADRETHRVSPRDALRVPRKAVQRETPEAGPRPGGGEAPASCRRHASGVTGRAGAGRNALASRLGRVERAARGAEPRVSAPLLFGKNAALFAIAAFTANPAVADVMFQGIAANTCAQILDVSSIENRRQIIDWTLGFFSGMNAAMSGADGQYVDLSKISSEDYVLQLIEEGCRGRENDRIFFVALDAYESLGIGSLKSVSPNVAKENTPP